MRLPSLRPGPQISIAHEFHAPPYGGANQFLIALRGELEARGFSVAPYRIRGETRACLLNSFVVDEKMLRRTLHPGCRVVHRVDGPVQEYRGVDDGADGRVIALNKEFADVTVVQSRSSLEAHQRLGLELANPVLIGNAVDPAIFFSSPRTPLAGRRIRLIASSWSDNPNKGASTLEWLDENLDRTRFEVTFVGRTQARFEHVSVVPPLPSVGVASLLREHDVYLAPSRNDPCSNALLEALACGLPAIYLRSGGHQELVGDAGLGFSADEEIPGLLARLVDEYEDRRRSISVPSLADVADRYLAAMEIEPRRAVA